MKDDAVLLFVRLLRPDAEVGVGELMALDELGYLGGLRNKRGSPSVLAYILEQKCSRVSGAARAQDPRKRSANVVPCADLGGGIVVGDATYVGSARRFDDIDRLGSNIGESQST